MKKTEFLPLGKRKILQSFFIVSLIITLFPFSVYAQSDSINHSLIQLIAPEEGSEIIAKKPVIKCAVTEPFVLENLLVLLDGVDVTGILDLTTDGFEFRPIAVIPSGFHTLSITLYTMDGKEVQREFSFSTRHSRSFGEAYSSNELTTIYESVLKKPKDVNIPYSKIESNLSSQTRLVEKGWEFTLTTNLRYLDQSLPVYSPEKKGFNLIDFMLQGKYSRGEFQVLTEIGDVRVNETQNTVQGLARRGGRLSMRYKSLELNTFVVKSEQVFGFEGGLGIESNTDDHIMGVSGEAGFFSNKVRFRTIYVTGGEPGGSFGLWTTGGAKKGDALGFVLRTDLFEQKLTTEAELDFSEFDADTSDEFSSESDKAYRLRAGGYSGNYSYEALYEYMGPDYEVIGNQGLQKNRQGFMLRTGANLKIHSINISFSQYNDNVKKDELYPRFYTSQGMIDYTFKKFQSLPIGVSYQKSILESAMEPELTPPMRMDTETISGRINYMKNRWNLGLQASRSIQDDRSEEGNDSITTTYTFTPAYFSEHLSVSPGFSFNQSEYKLTDMLTDTYTASLDLRGNVFHERLTYELAGTYNRIRSSDGSIKQDSLNTNLRLAYHPGKKFLKFLNPTVALRGLYNKTKDMVYKQENDEFILLLVFSTSMPFSF